MIVEVKQEHIDEGKQGECCYCAVTLAVRDALKDKYKFTDSQSLHISKAEVEVDESWIETAVQGSGAEISIYTKLEDDKIVEDIIVIEDEYPINSMSSIILEDWIEDFDTFDDSKPISFKIEDIHRMQQ